MWVFRYVRCNPLPHMFLVPHLLGNKGATATWGLVVKQDTIAGKPEPSGHQSCWIQQRHRIHTLLEIHISHRKGSSENHRLKYAKNQGDMFIPWRRCVACVACFCWMNRIGFWGKSMLNVMIFLIKMRPPRALTPLSGTDAFGGILEFPLSMCHYLYWKHQPEPLG